MRKATKIYTCLVEGLEHSAHIWRKIKVFRISQPDHGTIMELKTIRECPTDLRSLSACWDIGVRMFQG